MVKHHIWTTEENNAILEAMSKGSKASDIMKIPIISSQQLKKSTIEGHMRKLKPSSLFPSIQNSQNPDLTNQGNINCIYLFIV